MKIPVGTADIWAEAADWPFNQERKLYGNNYGARTNLAGLSVTDGVINIPVKNARGHLIDSIAHLRTGGWDVVVHNISFSQDEQKLRVAVPPGIPDDVLDDNSWAAFIYFREIPIMTSSLSYRITDKFYVSVDGSDIYNEVSGFADTVELTQWYCNKEEKKLVPKYPFYVTKRHNDFDIPGWRREDPVFSTGNDDKTADTLEPGDVITDIHFTNPHSG